MKLHRVGRIHSFILEHKIQTGVLAVGGLWVIITLIQLLYPWSALPPSARVEGVALGGKSIDEATKLLNKKYRDIPIQLFFGDSGRAYREPKPADIGLSIDAKSAVESQRYQGWQRLLPLSLFWAHSFASDTTATYVSDKKKAEEYIAKEFGKTCSIDPQNATLKYEDEKLVLVPAIDGGTCDSDNVLKLLTTIRPTPTHAEARIEIDEKPAKVTDKQVAEFASRLEARSVTGLTVVAEGSSVTIDQPTLLSWLVFKSPDTGPTAKVSEKKSKQFFDKQIAPKVTKPAGTSRITTFDFSIVSEARGASGQALNRAETIEAINEWLNGSDEIVSARISIVAPTIIYTRKYSSTDVGITALITQYAQSHSGIFGVSFIELDGKKRRAVYQDTKQFRSASTYKLFVALSTLKRIDSGKWKWTDVITGGKNLKKCFDEMIVYSYNDCAEALLTKITPSQIHKEIQQIGLTNSTLISDYIRTTAGDLTTFVGALEKGQLPLSATSRNTLLNAMERNIHRQGIPAGAKGSVADKVGFLPDEKDGIWYYNDAAIVYSPTGTYALSIMTKGSSWASIAELTRQIEKLRTQ